MSNADSAATLPTEDDESFFALRVASLTREANDTVSLILDIPESLKSRFAYRAGQYVTVRAQVGGKTLTRCYSMSTAPEVDPHLRITVKRAADGRVSEWINNKLRAGDTLDVMAPAGRFCLRRQDGALILLGAGSGITPLISLAKATLATTTRSVMLLYANRDRESVIFADELDVLAKAHAGRLTLFHWYDCDRGFVDEAALHAAGALLDPSADFYICGPAAFMDIAEAAALDAGADREHVFLERFVSPPDEDASAAAPAVAAPAEVRCETLTIRLRGQKRQATYRAGDTLLEAARRAGLRPPSVCQAGNCGSCIAKIAGGAATMAINNVLTPNEVADGYVLTCQALPLSKHVAVVYED